MNCEHARLLIGSDPGNVSAQLQEHLEQCPACSGFRSEMLALETKIQGALEQPPDGAPLVAPLAAPRRAVPAWREWAMAASILLATGAVLATWVLHPSDSLARDVVAHVKGEPDSWLSERHVSAPELAQALAGGGVKLELTSDKIVYAQSCFFHGHYVPHLVVQTVQGPATVLLLRHEAVTARRTFNEGGMSGIIVPAEGGGGIAIVERKRGDLDQVAQQLQQDVRWLPGKY